MVSAVAQVATNGAAMVSLAMYVRYGKNLRCKGHNKTLSDLVQIGGEESELRNLVGYIILKEQRYLQKKFVILKAYS
jgi:hypothetical protein